MSDQKPSESLIKNPQIVAAAITGLITILVAVIGILPNLLNKDTPTPEATVIVITATNAPTSTSVPTVESQPTAESISSVQTITPIPLLPTVIVPTTSPGSAAVTVTGNVLLLYDDVSFTLLNQGAAVLSLEGVVFRSSSGDWDARKWGPSLYNSLPSGYCLRLRDASTGARQPPAPCTTQTLYGLQVVGHAALFWINVDSFDVLQNDELIATCLVSSATCLINIS